MEISAPHLRPQRATEYLHVESEQGAAPFSIERDVAPYWLKIKRSIEEYVSAVWRGASVDQNEKIILQLYYVHYLFPERLQQVNLPLGVIEALRMYAMMKLRELESSRLTSPRLYFIAQLAVVDPMFGHWIKATLFAQRIREDMDRFIRKGIQDVDYDMIYMKHIFVLFPDLGREMVQKHRTLECLLKDISRTSNNQFTLAAARIINPQALSPVDAEVWGRPCKGLRESRDAADWSTFILIAANLAILSADRITIDEKGVHLFFPLESQQHPLPERMIV